MARLINNDTRMVKKMVRNVLAEACGEQRSEEKPLNSSGIRRIELGKVFSRAARTVRKEERLNYVDVITQRESPDINASILEIGKNSCEWRYPYDSLVYILAGHVELNNDGNVIKGTAGDLVFIPGDLKVQFLAVSAAQLLHIKPKPLAESAAVLENA